MVLKVVTTLHQEVADMCDFNLRSFCGRVYIQSIDREKVLVEEARKWLSWKRRERVTVKFTEETKPRNFSVADSVSEDEYSTCDNDVQLSGQGQSAGVC